MESHLSLGELKHTIESGLLTGPIQDKTILVITPDATRTCPLPLVIRALGKTVGKHASHLDFMVALGTHPPLSKDHIMALYGLVDPQTHACFRHSRFMNHRWDRPDTFETIGRISGSEIAEISGGLFSEAVPVLINKEIFNYDTILVIGPVFPHEAVGFSGGGKYFFPGISGGEFLHLFHWLGAMITCRKIIGIKDTPVRRLIDLAMEKVDVPVYSLALVLDSEKRLKHCFAGNIKETWEKAADLSSKYHIKNMPRTYKTVLAHASIMYNELWTAGKAMYKLEQVVADQGELIVYGPHIDRISQTWGSYIEQVGYHVRDYFAHQMDVFRHVPKVVLTHSTHVRGEGSFENGVEMPRIHVSLATSIPQETCEKVNLGYRDPHTVLPSDYIGKEDQGILYVAEAGEILYKPASRNRDH